MKYLLYICLALSLVACDKDDDNPADKNLFSLWTNDATGSYLDLSGMSIGDTKLFTLFYVDNSACTCELTFIGRQTDGVYALAACKLDTPNYYHDCAAENETGTYSKPASQLTICSNVSLDCGTFH